MSDTANAVRRPICLRARGAGLAIGVGAILIAGPALAQSQEPEEVELDTLQIEDSAADVNPYVQPGSPYKARVSGDPRRVVPLAETPATIQVLTATQIAEQGETDLRDVLDNLPGVTVGTGENGNAFGDRYIIRGQEVRSDVFVDGLRDPGMTIRETFAVEQIEVTKGPSASFGGRGTTGGAVNSITKQASTEYNFNRVDLGIGTDNYWRGTLDSNWRLSDNVAVRANLLYAYEEVPNRQPSDRERWGGALSASFQLGDAVRLLLDYYHLTATDTPDLGGYLPAPTGTAGNVTIHRPWDEVPAYAQRGDFLKSDVNTFTARLFIEPFEGLRIVNSTRYGMAENGYVVTGLRGGAFNPTTATYAPLTLSSHQGWQDVDYFVNQLNMFGEFSTGSVRHSLILGAEYSDHQVLNGVYRLTNTGAFNCRTSGTGAFNAYCLTVSGAERALVAGDINNILGRQITRGPWDIDWRVETLSFYLMDTIDLAPWLTLHGGVRMDAFTYRNIIQNTNTLAQTPYRYNDTLWNGHLGLVLKPSDDGMIYAAWGTSKEINGGESDLGSNCGYGGICIVTGVNDVGDGAPESATNFEIGTKWDLFGNRLLIQAAAFQLTKDDVFEAGSAGSYSQFGSLNTGRHRIRGIELGLVGNITERLSGQIGASFMDSEILRTAQQPPATAPAGSTLVGKRLSNFANTQFSGQLRYQASAAFSFGGTATYRSAIYAGQPDSPASYDFNLGVYRFRVPSYWLFDAFAEYRFNETFSARLNVNNIGNEDYYLAGYQSGHFLYKGDERRATLTLTGRF
ncbi:TonB-dependent receptor [Altererythrobacter lauratis]|uniref:TonB-dependent receptor n=1 Tax=Alteraurantiacibacter lauratis TaxID=2054627 RepID=A0ABV7EJQ7_9SPHN